MFKYLEGAVSALKLLQLKFTVAWVTALLALNSFVTKSRMSHENGIVTRGRLREQGAASRQTCGGVPPKTRALAYPEDRHV